MVRFTFLSILLAVLAGHPALGAEKLFDFSQNPVNGFPAGFVSKVTGLGKAGEWKIVEEEFEPQFAPLSPNAPKPKRPVLAQLSQEPQDERFPFLMYNDDSYSDFSFSTKLRIVRGNVEQMAGLAFRIQDEKNYYVVRVSAEGDNVRFYKFVDGIRSQPIGPEIKIEKNIWYELSVECKGNQIRCFLDGKEIIPTLTDNSFNKGKLGFWTKSDSVAYFRDSRVVYTPRVPLAQTLIDSTMAKFPRLLGLKIYAFTGTNTYAPKVIASTNAKEINAVGDQIESDVIRFTRSYFARGKEVCEVTVPVKDRNGETVAALRIRMKPFAGQTENNALGRALPIKNEIEAGLLTSKDLIE